MHAEVQFHSLSGRGTVYWVVLAILVVISGASAGSALYLEHHGHWVSGMSNQLVWGLPHVFSVFLLVAASGALNVASIGSVFGKEDYKPVGRLSVLLAGSLLIGGVLVLALDLGRADRLPVAMVHLNPTSIFCLNLALYGGFLGFVAAYLWVGMDPRMARFYKPVAVGAFLWRLVLTTGTGSIFGFIVARSLYHSALMAPMFIALSLSLGLAAFNVVALALEKGFGLELLSPELSRRLRILLAVLAAVSLYMVGILELTNLYSAEHRDAALFLLAKGGIHTVLLWGGFVLVGSLLPIALLLRPTVCRKACDLGAASFMVMIGGLCLMFVIIIGGQAFPIEIFPGKTVMSSFSDGAVVSYIPSIPEIFLALGSFGIAGLTLIAGLRVFDLLPRHGSSEQ